MTPERATVRVHDLDLSYLVAGEGPTVLLLHGWPTSSFLWRRVMPAIARKNRVIALDLPGFGRSDKPVDASYSFRFHERMLTGFLGAVGAEDIGLAVHDLGGPIGLYWALRHQDRIRRLALLNTVVYARPSWAVVAFVAAARTPLLRDALVSPRGLEWALRIGLSNPENATPEVVRAVVEPFESMDAQRVLLKSAYALHISGMIEIEKRIPSFDKPLRIIYGKGDRILPDVERTMRRVAHELPQAVVTGLDHCGHFLQEERGEEVGEMLGEFFGKEG
jgi:pimeloyl-ACP methyl ester carboxylesterase